MESTQYKRVAFHRKGRGQIFFAEVTEGYLESILRHKVRRADAKYGIRREGETGWTWISVHPEEAKQ